MSDYSVTETAKLIRVALKKKFPDVKFSVRSNSYSMGASIDISYTDGPKTKDVEAITGPYAGAGFDGMIDMKYYKTSYMLKDGTVTYGESEGTTNSAGMNPAYENPLPEGAKKVSFGADYIFVHRYHSVAAVKQGLKELAELMNYPEWANLEVVQGYQTAHVKDGDKHFLGDARDYHWSVSSMLHRHMAGVRI